MPYLTLKCFGQKICQKIYDDQIKIFISYIKLTQSKIVFFDISAYE